MDARGGAWAGRRPLPKISHSAALGVSVARRGLCLVAWPLVVGFAESPKTFLGFPLRLPGSRMQGLYAVASSCVSMPPETPRQTTSK